MGHSPRVFWTHFLKWLWEPPRALKAALVALVLYRFVLALVFPVFSDPSTYFIYAKALARDPSIYLQRDFVFPPPLVPGLGALLVTWAGEVGLKLMAPAFGALGIFYTCRLGRALYSERVGLVGALFLAILPAHLHYSALGYLDAPVTAFSVMTLYYTHRAFQRDSPRDSLLGGAAAGLAAISKQATGLSAGALILVYFLARSAAQRRLGARSLRLAALALFAAAAVAAPYYGRNALFYHGLATVEGLGTVGGTSVHSPLAAAGPDPGDGNSGFVATISAAYGGGFAQVLPSLLGQNYLEAWGFPSGRLDVIPLPPALVALYVAATVFLSAFLLAGLLRAVHHPSRLLFLWLLLWMLSTLMFGADVLYSFRRLLPLAPVLALFAALGWEEVRERLGGPAEARKSQRNRLPLRRVLLPGLLVLAVLAGAAAAATEAGKAAVAVSYYEARKEPLAYLASLPAGARVMAPDKDLVDYYAGKIALHLPQWRPESVNLTTLQRLGVTHVVVDGGYIWYDLSPYRRALDSEVDRGGARLAGTWGPVRVYEVIR